MGIVALIGDGHTHLGSAANVQRYPLELRWFGDELRVIAAQAPYHSAVGARVLAIGSTPPGEVMELAKQLVPRAENDGCTLVCRYLLTNNCAREKQLNERKQHCMFLSDLKCFAIDILYEVAS